MSTCKHLFRSAVILTIASSLYASAARAEWSQAVKLAELNSDGSASLGSLTADQRLIVFFRNGSLMEAWRQDPSGPFTEERVVHELNPTSVWDAWVSADGLRLYYADIVELEGKMQRVIKLAARATVDEPWIETKTFLEIHRNGIIDTNPTLTADELTMVWYSQRYVSDPELRKYTATRATVDAPFTNVRELTEFRTFNGAKGLHLSGDGLRIYFSAVRDDVGFRNAYVGTRTSLDTSFANFQVLEGICGPDLQAGAPWLTADEKTVYFNSNRDGDSGIWVSHWLEDPYEAAVGRLEESIAGKRELLAAATARLEDDRAALEALNALAAAGVVDRVIILQTKIDIFQAIQRQIAARKNIERSIADLEEALKHLHSEPKRPPRDGGKGQNGPVGPRITKTVQATRTVQARK